MPQPDRLPIEMRPIDRLLAIMSRLRDPAGGCEWDIAQTWVSIAPYTIEEAYEVVDAIDRGDIADLRGELGDLLLQVVFHARIAEEAGHFGFEDVASAIADKLESRHPHVFGPPSDLQPGVTDFRRLWEDRKQTERSEKGMSGILDGIPLALPALVRAEKLQKRAARVGFDWPDLAGPVAKVREELAELTEAETAEDRFEEAGDLLFAAVNAVRACGIAPEDALRAANLKFERRFRQMEALAATRSQEFAALAVDDQEALWQEAKRQESLLRDGSQPMEAP